MLRELAFADVPEYHHDADELSVREPYRSAAVVDRNAPAVAGDQDRVVGEADDAARLQYPGDRVLHRLAAELIYNAEDLLERLISCVRQRPAGDPLGHRVEERHTSGHIGHDDRVTDALQRDFERFSLPPEVLFVFVAAVGCHLAGGPWQSGVGAFAATIVPDRDPASARVVPEDGQLRPG